MKNKLFSRKKIIISIVLIASLSLLSLFILLFTSLHKNTDKNGRKCYKHQTFIVKQNLIFGVLATHKCSWYERNCDNMEIVYLNSPEKTYEQIYENGRTMYMENPSKVNYRNGQKIKAISNKCWVRTGTHKYIFEGKQKVIPALELINKYR